MKLTPIAFYIIDAYLINLLVTLFPHSLLDGYDLSQNFASLMQRYVHRQNKLGITTSFFPLKYLNYGLLGNMKNIWSLQRFQVATPRNFESCVSTTKHTCFVCF